MHENEKVVHTVSGGCSYNGVIAGCDPDIGVTIIDEDNPGSIVFCLRNPDVHLAMFREEFFGRMSEDEIEDWLKDATEYFNSDFSRLLSEIKTGKTSSGTKCGTPVGGISKLDCPFNG